MDDSAPETWADAAPLEEAEFTYSNMTSFLSGMGVGPFATGRGGSKAVSDPEGCTALGLPTILCVGPIFSPLAV